MPNAFPDGLNVSDVSPVTYIDSIMNGESALLPLLTQSTNYVVPLFDISRENQFL